MQTSFTIEFAFGAAPDASAPAWTNVTAYVLHKGGINIRRGVTNERDQLQAGTCSFLLQNSDRRFDPTHAAGPYFGNLRPRTPVRIRATYSATTWTLFRGVVDGGWPQSYSNRDQTVPITAVDAFGYLAQSDTEATAWDAEIADMDLKASWWPLTAPAGTKTPDIVQASYADTHDPILEMDTPIVGSSVSVMNLGTDIAAGYVDTTDPTTFPPGKLHASAQTIEMWVRPASFSGPTPYVFAVVDSSNRYLTAISIEAFTTPAVDWVGVFSASVAGSDPYSYFGADDSVAALSPFADGDWHHLVVASDGTTSGASWRVYVDGKKLTHALSATTAVTAPGAQYRMMVGASGASLISGGSPPTLSGGAFCELVVYDDQLTDAEIAAHYAAGRVGREGDTVSARLSWICARSSWDLISVTAGTGTTIRYPFRGGESALALIQQLHDTEQGRIWVDRDGQVRLSLREWAWSETAATTVQATFSDDGADLGYRADDTVIVYDDRRLINTATVQRYDGQPQTRTDAASVATYGQRSDSLDGLLVASDASAAVIAEWFVYANKDPQFRVDRITFQPEERAATAIPVAQQIELGWLVNVERTPAGGGSAIDVNAHVVGIEHQITAEDWLVTLNLDGTRAGRTFWTWGTSQWDTTSIWGF